MPELTPEQREAVETDAREVLVLAPAGSGKTRVLTHRIRHLLTRCGASPADLMVLTFTRKAATEMRGRLHTLLRDDGIADPERYLRGMRCGTFHAVALHMLRRDGDQLGYLSDSLVVIDEHDADALLKQVARDLGCLKADGKWRGGLSMVKVRSALESCYTNKLDPSADPIKSVIREYWYRLKQLNALDYGMILRECETLLRLHDDVAERWRRQTKHVLVDEYQDTDLVQYTLHHHFAPPAAFFAVADRRQAIYGFRGARPDLMTEQHPCATVIDLARCFRCGDRIVDAANRLIEHNGDTLARPMIGETRRDGRVSVVHGRTVDLADGVSFIGRTDGYRWQDIAVLARKHATLRRIEEVMREQDIPVHRVGRRFDVCTSEGFRDVLAAMRLTVDDRDNLSFLRLLEWLGVSSRQYAQIRQTAADRGVSHAQAYMDIHENRPPLAELLLSTEWATVREWCGPVLGTNDIRDWWVEHCGDMTLADALDWHALRDQQEDFASGDVVTLATIHAAKGLEWPAVIIAEMQEGTFPSTRSLKEPDGLHEERRVCYVAMTRARERLVLHYRRPEDQSENRPTRARSRFVGECGVTA